VSHVHIVYAHPSERSFTREILDAFVDGLVGAGHTFTLSDLYAMGFRPELSAAEYERETAHRADLPIPDDVAAEHARLNAADVWAFIYPVWWSDCPALLKGWFDRVWTVGFAYRPAGLRVARRALLLCTTGYAVTDLDTSGVHQAMRTAMLTDRIGARALSSELVVFGASVLRNDESPGDAQRWVQVKARHLAHAAELARAL
jgi:NAD(P)H dehydrogenase (quinone)